MSVIGAELGYGQTVEIGDDGSPVVYTALVGVQQFSFSMGRRERVDVTHHASPNSTKESILGLKDSRDISVPLLFVKGSATDTLLRGLHASGAQRQIRFGDTAAVTEEYVVFNGRVADLEYDFPVEGPMTCTVTFLVDAEVVE
jgi:hypothetical protein